MPPVGRLLPTGVGGREDAITPIIGTMLVFVIIFGGMAGALVFGVPAITGLQDRAAVDDMATQLQGVRREAERLTAEGIGSSVALAPSQGSINLEEGTRMAVAVSYDGSSSQEGLALAWGKGGKKKSGAQLRPECDFHVKDWQDGDATVKVYATDCHTPMRWDPADGGTGSYLTQTLEVTSVASATGWTSATQANLASSDNAYATYSSNNPGATTNHLRVAVADGTSNSDTILGVVVKAEVKASGGNDAFKLKVCISTACEVDNTRQGSSSTDNVIEYNVTNDHPDGNVDWEWSHIPNLEAAVQLEQQGSQDGTWSVDRIWVEVTTGPDTSSGNNNGKCFTTNDAACLQAFKLSDTTSVNRVVSITEIGSTEVYTVVLDSPLADDDWYFQMSSDPRNPDTDRLLAKAFFLSQDRLRWVRDQGLATWLEGGAVFATRQDTHYLHSAPIVDEEIVDTSDTEPTYYIRLIRFQGEDQSISGTGTTNVLLRHNETHSTHNDGVAIIRFDFLGEGAELWCNALMMRDVPAGYYYTEHASYPCDGSANNSLRSVKYDHPRIVACGGTSPPGCTTQSKTYYQLAFTEVLFDVILQP